MGIASSIRKAGKLTGRALLRLNREAGKLEGNLDRVLGEDRTRPSDGFSSDRVRQKASMSSPRNSRRPNKRVCAFGCKKGKSHKNRNFFSNTSSNSRGYSRSILGESNSGSREFMPSKKDRDIF